MYGAIITNPQGHLLISSEVEGLHCAGRVQFLATVESGLEDFDNFARDERNVYGVLWGRHIHRYVLHTGAMPLFFIKPHPRALDCTHGILRQWRNTHEGNWYVDIVQYGRGGPFAPTVYAFVQPRFLPDTPEHYGMLVQRADGTVTFDSRKKPLVIYDVVEAESPQYPCNDGLPTESDRVGPWNTKQLEFDFNCDNSYKRYDISPRARREDLMFSAPCLGQAVYSWVKRGYKLSVKPYTSQQHHSTALWWAMYHQAYRINTGSLIAGWAMYRAGFDFWSQWEDTSIGGSGGTSTKGSRPYFDKTINMGKNTVIIVDARYYE